MCAVLLFHSSRNGLTVFYLKQKIPLPGHLSWPWISVAHSSTEKMLLAEDWTSVSPDLYELKRLLTFPLVAGMVCWEQLWATRLFSLANNMVYRGKFSGDYVGFGWLLSVPPYFELIWFTDASEMSFRLILVLYPGLRAHKLNDRALLTSFHQTWPPSESEFSLKMV